MRPTIEKILDKFTYDRDEGKLYHRRTVRAGREAGFLSDNGHGGIYRRVCIDGKKYYTHAIIQFLETGKWPDLVDHRDGDTLNNVGRNLRTVSDSVNQQNRKKCNKNNKLGVKGVSLCSSGKFRADICHQAKKIRIGVFDTLEEAKSAYDAKAAELHNSNFDEIGVDDQIEMS